MSSLAASPGERFFSILGFVVAIFFLFGTALIVKDAVRAKLDLRRVIREGKYVESEVPAPRPRVLDRWVGSKALEATSGRKIYLLDTRTKELEETDDDGEPYAPAYAIALTAVPASFPSLGHLHRRTRAERWWMLEDTYGRNVYRIREALKAAPSGRVFAVDDGWAICYERQPISVVELGSFLDAILSSLAV